MTNWLRDIRPTSDIVPESTQTIAEYRGRHGNADIEVTHERRVRETHHRDYVEYETHEVRHARARVWRQRLR